MTEIGDIRGTRIDAESGLVLTGIPPSLSPSYRREGEDQHCLLVVKGCAASKLTITPTRRHSHSLNSSLNGHMMV
jgi:hypothetical protein